MNNYITKDIVNQNHTIILLSSNRTTGYQWYIKSLNGIDINNYKYINKDTKYIDQGEYNNIFFTKIYKKKRNPEKLMGVGGHDIFLFYTKNKKIFDIEFILKRPWENNIINNKYYKLNFK